MSLGYHDLADIRLRHSLRASKGADVAALLDEVDELRGFLVAAFKAEPAVVDLFGSGRPLAIAAEFCSICSPGHADGYGFCERHGKKVRGMWSETTGPIQTGLVCLLALGAPLFDLFADAWGARPALAARPQARSRRAH